MSQTPTNSPSRWRAIDLEAIRIALSIPALMPAIRAISDAMADLEQLYPDAIPTARRELDAIGAVDNQLAGLGPSALQPYANARILLFSNAIPGVLDSERTGGFVFERYLKRQRGISSKENSPGLDTGDFTYEGNLTRGAMLPQTPSQPWDWLAAAISWSTSGIRPVSADTPALLTPCLGAMWPGPLVELRSPGLLPSPSRGQLATFSVTEFGGLYGAGGIGSLTQPLLGERVQAALKPNRLVVVGSGESLNLLAERHLTTVTTLRSLNPTLTGKPSDPQPVGS